jgi:hypothetical protein
MDRDGLREVERYIQGYLEQPEQAEEVDEIHPASYATLAAEPWNWSPPGLSVSQEMDARRR